jgi:hypothetical protein
VALWWLAVASQGGVTGQDAGRLFLHIRDIRTDRAVDVPWDRVLADQVWLDTLGLRAAAPELRAGAEALRDGRIGEQRQVVLAGGTAVLEVRPDARIATWLADLDLAREAVAEPDAAPVLAEEPE